MPFSPLLVFWRLNEKWKLKMIVSGHNNRESLSFPIHSTQYSLADAQVEKMKYVITASVKSAAIFSINYVSS